MAEPIRVERGTEYGICVEARYPVTIFLVGLKRGRDWN
jgi:hypothetical protein